MLDLRIIARGTSLPVFDLPAVLGRRQAAKEIGDQIDALIAFIDDLGGDPDLEDGNDLEADDERELSYSEWHTRDAKTSAAGHELRDTSGTDDDEDDDSDCCAAGEDHIIAGPIAQREWFRGRYNIGSEDDAERNWRGNFASDVEAGTLAANDL